MPKTKRCVGLCQETLPVEEFDRDESKADGLKTWCKQCRKAKRDLKERREIEEIVQNIEAPTLIRLGAAQDGGPNLPHHLQVLEGIVGMMGGCDGFVTFYVAQIIAAPPGGVIRERMLNTILRAIQMSSDDVRVSRPRSMMSTEELLAQYRGGLKLLGAEERPGAEYAANVS